MVKHRHKSISHRDQNNRLLHTSSKGGVGTALTDNLTYGTIIYVSTGTDDSFNTLTEDGIDELREMLKDARRSEDAWNGFLEDFVEDPDIIAHVKCRGPR